MNRLTCKPPLYKSSGTLFEVALKKLYKKLYILKNDLTFFYFTNRTKLCWKRFSKSLFKIKASAISVT